MNVYEVKKKNKKIFYKKNKEIKISTKLSVYNTV